MEDTLGDYRVLVSIETLESHCHEVKCFSFDSKSYPFFTGHINVLIMYHLYLNFKSRHMKSLFGKGDLGRPRLEKTNLFIHLGFNYLPE